jgi:ferredoxin/flavodoxin---NADP+ reductase
MMPAEDKFYRARIVERRNLTDDLWIIRVAPGGEFRFTAGQYATLGADTPDRRIERPYSIVSSPYESLLEFFIELVSIGELTPELHKLQVGDALTLRKVAKGRFTLDTQSGRKNHLLLCTVTGVAPFMSYMRTLSRDGKEGRFSGQHRLFLLEGASRSSEFGYREEIETLAAEVPWVQFVPTISRPWEDPDWKGEVGRVEDLVRKYIDLWGLVPGETSVYLCGNPNMIENCKDILKRARWQKNAIKEELYFIPGKQVV